MRILIILVTLAISGCGAYGEPLLLARMADRADPCQRPLNQKPTWCGASDGVYSVTRDWSTGRYLTYNRYYQVK
jgi:hypothetical protein